MKTGIFKVGKSDWSKNTIDGIYPIVDSHTHKFLHNDTVNYNLNPDGTATILSLNSPSSEYRTAKIPLIINITALKRYGYTKKNVPIYLGETWSKHLPKMFVSTKIKRKLKPPYNNQLAIVKFQEWTKEYPTAKVLSILGDCNNDEVTYKYLVYCHNLSNKKTKIPSEISFDIDKFDLSGYIDKTSAKVFSIDPPGTLDIDDAVEIKSLSPDKYQVTVFIADPTALITYYNNSDFNNSIIKKLQTVYTPGRNYPMIPEKFSNDLCSLLPNKKRLALSLTFLVGLDGLIDDKSWKFEKSIIVNKKAYSYKQAEDIINKSIIKNNDLKILSVLTQNIAQLQFKKLYKKKWDTHKMIEVLMVLTNQYAARFIKNNKTPIKPIYRYHEDSGIKPPDDVSEDVLSNIKFIGMTSAKYTMDSTRDLSHYGLGIEDYTHFTSPIRRFTDVFSHFIIKNIIYDDPIPKEFYFKDLNKFIKTLNDNNTNSKRLSLDIDRIAINNKISILPEKMLKTQVCVLDFWDEGLVLYSEEINMRFYHRLVNESLDDLYKVNISEDKSNISVVELKTENIITNIKKYEMIWVELYSVKHDNIKFRLVSKLLN